MSEIIRPSVDLKSFSCPECGAFAAHEWFAAFANQLPPNTTAGKFITIRVAAATEATGLFTQNRKKVRPLARSKAPEVNFVLRALEADAICKNEVENLFLAQCYSCQKVSVWRNRRLIYPTNRGTFIPNKDLNDDIRSDFLEAASIVEASPRGAAAILRLCVQKICRNARGGKDEDLNDAISGLAKKGLDSDIVDALDIVRVIGNEAVHPGQLDLRDDIDTASKLFDLVNLIADVLISQPKLIAKLRGKLPKKALKGIENRDQ